MEDYKGPHRFVSVNIDLDSEFYIHHMRVNLSIHHLAQIEGLEVDNLQTRSLHVCSLRFFKAKIMHLEFASNAN